MTKGEQKWSRGAYRLEAICTLQFRGPLHVGTGERLSVVSDAPILRDGNGKAWLPGSSVRGVLRDWCEREAPLLGIGREAVQRLFGVTEKDGGKKGDDRQGRLTVFDAELTVSEVEVRDHVKINREWGAALRGAKFDQESAVVSTGTLRLVYEGDRQDDPEVTLLRSAVSALEEGLLAFGGKTGWGFGAIEVPGKVRWKKSDRRQEERLSDYLIGRLSGGASLELRNTEEPEKEESAESFYEKAVPRAYRKGEPRPWSWLRLRLKLTFDGPMLIAAPYRGDRGIGHENRRDADAAYQTDAAGKPLLPGSSLRGALHSHADRIATTIDRSSVNQPSISETLFGSAKEGAANGMKGLVRIGEGRLVGEAKPILLNHVAIDRITGFSADSKLFSSAALASPHFETEVRVQWHPDDEEQMAAAALLLLTLRDLEAGLLWVGSRTTRGYGYVKTVSVLEATVSEVVKGEDGTFCRKGVERRGAGEEESDATIRKLGELGPVKRLFEAWARCNEPKPEEREVGNGQ